MSVITGVQAALLLARGRPEGVSRMPAEPDAVLHSFWAIVICLPAFLCLRLLDWADTGLPSHPAHEITVQLIFYLLGWLAFVEVSRPLAGLLERRERWPLFIAVWNWCNVVQYLLLVLAALPSLLGAPGIVSETVSLVAVGWALWLEWYAARLTLGVGVLAAAGLVAMDLAIGIAVAAVTDALT